jgi:Transposase domain (DUF772)
MITLEQPAVRTETNPLPPASALKVWPDPASLANRVVQITLAIDEGQLVPVAATWTGTALQPRTLLALLVYCYAVGVFRSQAIEEQMHQDLQFRLLCGDEYPDWHQLRRFRRLNRPVIQHCLEQVLGWASGGRSANFDCAVPPRIPEPPAPPNPPQSGLPAAVAQEANDRLNWAAQLDSMDLDV